MNSQDEQLYITDPRAMYHVLVKDMSIWEEPQSLLVYVHIRIPLSLCLLRYHRMNRALLGEGLLATLGALQILRFSFLLRVPLHPSFFLTSLTSESCLTKTYTGVHHKWQRKILNPFFSEKHMRDLLPIFWPVVNKV